MSKIPPEIQDPTIDFLNTLHIKHFRHLLAPWWLKRKK